MSKKRLFLNDVEWGEFRFTEVFDAIFIAPSSDSNKLKKGNIPFIGRSSLNNGLQGEYEVDYTKIIEANCITISMVGEPKSFYQNYDFTCSQNILILRNDAILNRKIADFLCSIINQYLIKKGYGYGYPIGLNRIKRNSLYLPKNNGNPNWKFMEDYIKQEQKEIAQKVISYYERKMLEAGFDLVGLEDVEWKSFNFNEIFRKIQRGKRLKKDDHIDGNIPYVSSTSLNNGIDSFIGNKDYVRKFKDNLSLANSGSVGSCFYHQYEYVASDHITSLTLENPDKYIYLFMSTIINRFEDKYSFNREINDKRIKKEKIILPSDEKGNPHWDYMSKFMQNLEAKNLDKALRYIYIYIYMS